MDWIKGEPSHDDGVEVIGWWPNSQTHSIILWSERDKAWLCNEDGAVMSSPAHYILLNSPTN